MTDNSGLEGGAPLGTIALVGWRVCTRCPVIMVPMPTQRVCPHVARAQKGITAPVPLPIIPTTLAQWGSSAPMVPSGGTSTHVRRAPTITSQPEPRWPTAHHVQVIYCNVLNCMVSFYIELFNVLY